MKNKGAIFLSIFSIAASASIFMSSCGSQTSTVDPDIDTATVRPSLPASAEITTTTTAAVTETADTTETAPVADDASGSRDDRADRDAWSAPSRDDYVSTIDDDMDGVQVYERGSAPSRPAVGVNPVTPAGSRSFRDRFQDKVVAANVAGWQDEGIGRSKARTLADETRPPASVRNAPSADVSGKDLEAELAARRRESEAARAERDTVLISPKDRFVIVVLAMHVLEGILYGFRFRRARHAPLCGERDENRSADGRQ